MNDCWWNQDVVEDETNREWNDHPEEVMSERLLWSQDVVVDEVADETNREWMGQLRIRLNSSNPENKQARRTIYSCQNKLYNQLESIPIDQNQRIIYQNKLPNNTSIHARTNYTNREQ